MRADTKKKILFVCIGNMCRSPMAEGFARVLGGESLEAYSAGIAPTGSLSQDSIAAMREVGIDISTQQSNGVDAVPLNDIDLVVNMSSQPPDMFLPPDFTGRIIDWHVKDPVGSPLRTYRLVRDDIARRVRELLEQLER
jgi:protein-tyrosine-phosphatase